MRSVHAGIVRRNIGYGEAMLRKAGMRVPGFFCGFVTAARSDARHRCASDSIDFAPGSRRSLERARDALHIN